MVRYSDPIGPKGHFLGGSFPAFRADPLAFLMDAASYGDFTYFRMGAFHAYLVNHPDLIHQVLVTDAAKYHKSRILKRTTSEIIGDGLLTSEGEFHKRQRRMIQPAFHHQRIGGYAEIMARRTAAMLDAWQDGQEFDVTRQMNTLTLQIVSEALFGADVSDEAEQIGEAISLGVEAVGSAIRSPLRQLPIWIPTHENRERKEAAAYIKSTIMGMIEARRRDRDLHERADLLSMLLIAMDDETCSTMTADQVYDEAVTLFIAGHETTAIALSWALYLISQHPHIEAWLRDDLSDVKRVDYVVKEAMRLYPPAWVISRLAPDDIPIAGYTVRKGAGVLISPYVTHRDPRWYADPLVFNPHRWAADDSGLELEKRIPKYAYISFGGGPRVCIGQPFAMMEMQMIIPLILQRFALSLLPDQRIEADPLVTLRAKYGIKMRLCSLGAVGCQASAHALPLHAAPLVDQAGQLT